MIPNCDDNDNDHATMACDDDNDNDNGGAGGDHRRGRSNGDETDSGTKMTAVISTPLTATSSSSPSSFVNSFQWPFSASSSSTRPEPTAESPHPSPPERVSSSKGRSFSNALVAMTPKPPAASIRAASEASTTETIRHTGLIHGGEREREPGPRGIIGGVVPRQRLRPSPLQSILDSTTPTYNFSASASSATRPCERHPSSTQSAPPLLTSTFPSSSPMAFPLTPNLDHHSERPIALTSLPSSFDESYYGSVGCGGEVTPLVQKLQYLENSTSIARNHTRRTTTTTHYNRMFPMNLPHGRSNTAKDNQAYTSGTDTRMYHMESSSFSSYSTTSMLCGYGAAWIFWVMIWIIILAEVMRIHDMRTLDDDLETDDGYAAIYELLGTNSTAWTRLDRIYFATSIFWSVGGMVNGGASGTGGRVGNSVTGSVLSTSHPTLLPNSNQERLIICGFVLLSLGFWALALGQWGNAMIEAHNAASMAQIHAQERARRLEEQRRYHKEQRQRRLRYQSQRQGHRPSGITLALIESEHELNAQTSTFQHKYQRHHYLDGKSHEVGDDEQIMSDAALNDDGNVFQMFPGLPWLLVQSILCTALTVFWVVGIQYYEQRGPDLVDPSTQEVIINHIAAKSGRPAAEVAAKLTTTAYDNAWDAVSTIYYAMTTAYTLGLGDVTPVTRDGKILAVFFIPLAVTTALHWVVWMAQACIERTQRNKLSRRDVKLRLDQFYEGRLVSMGLVDEATFASLKREYEMMPAAT